MKHPEFNRFLDEVMKNPEARKAYERVQRRRGLRMYFDFNDWWVGYYRGPNHHYVCLLPTMVICWRRR